MNIKIFKLFVFFHLLFFFIACTNPQSKLPILGPKEVVQAPFDDYALGDTIYHSLPYFELINQKGDTISGLDYRGKIHLANFFFATCPQVCPVMMEKINRLAEKWKNRPVEFISFTVNPSHDTPQVLEKYVQDKKLETTHWNLLTGEKQEIYALAGPQGYLLNVGEDALAEGGFFHSMQVVLVDGQFRIRGIYDSTSDKELQQLEQDLPKLLKEEQQK